MKYDVKAVLDRVLTWPAEAQREAVATLRAIEEEWVSGDDITNEEKNSSGARLLRPECFEANNILAPDPGANRNLS